MKQGIVLFILIVGLLTFMNAPPVAADEAVVQVDHLNVRTGPSKNHEAIGKVHTGATYTILEEKDNWLKIKRNNDNGWVAKWLTEVETAGTSKGTQYSNYDYLRIRSSPGLDGKIKGYLMKGDQVKPTETDGKWYRIQKGNTNGWVHRDYLSPQHPKNEPHKKKESSSSSVNGKVKVGTDVLNVRSQNSTKGRLLTQVQKGQVYEYIAKKDRWYEIKYTSGKTGWVAGWLVNEVSNEEETPTTTEGHTKQKNYVSLNYNGTNLRAGPSTNDKIVGRGNKGDRFDIVSKEGQWYKVSNNGNEMYVAGWIVEEHAQENSTSAPAQTNSLKGKTIMIDAGHGGRDPGALGRSGSYEKTLTLETAFNLKKELESKGAKVLMTRTEDHYMSLSVRSYHSNHSDADVFISLHYNSTPLSIPARGISSYYYNVKDKALATSLQSSITTLTGMKNRGIQKGNFHVIRENSKPAVLLELGFISDAREEQIIKTNSYQTKASQGITEGLIKHFN
ncbi:N-acetylmuramoyl-L-alanine amidase [Halobacillus karajensis]|uniref:Sporulation-specific N-acetylmuramoyl-L-alanine amidase n=1 Tax=Halobacillus karajensis TaxID=195088 RepID=A0A024P5W0_9BACI|nr:SH3 domain-containing protein [Halobacillus karajensis]CDQ18103.1 Sporulation-specific N-acetylmuramoyl-L-alanine amidase [Halobacillus karajensis]CDQ24454.1 Sporulation-specific N-acetylmuramoyl-L-alanine amidase [Halobacillus karajensis]CDQ29298.1 Sporulation-specific N-acetylmuramoyl-L-alanine amidase [Halobacillus karajensis]SEH59221.1 N-acetylmuramoyl-L-alanine amidase [Halobacillus karajensis]